MTPSELKYQVKNRGTETYFFTRKTMKFFGDTMRNYGVRETTIETHYDDSPIEVYELYRRRPVNGGRQSSTYFRKSNFERVHPK